MHWLTLRFSDQTLERAFAEASLARVARQGKIAVWMGILVYLVHGFVLDLVLPAPQVTGLWSMRLTAMLVPVLMLLLHPTQWFAKHCHMGLSMVGFAAGWGLIAMQTMVHDDYASAFYPLIVEVAFYTYNFVGVRFVYALGVDLSLLVLYNVVFGIWHPYPVTELVGHDFFLFSANLIGGTAGYLAERQKRLLFLQREELARAELRLREGEAERARVLERTRILRDMHDGVGAHISSAIRQLQSPAFHTAEVLATLRDSLDQLKLSIDAMHLEPGDITTLLANLRYRMEPRLRAMHLELFWDVGMLPHLDYLSVDSMRQLQFLLLEVLSNVMQHSHATTLRVVAHVRTGADACTSDGVCLMLVDNGHGFDTGNPFKKGLAAVQERARAIHAQLTINSKVGETSVEVYLPMALPVA
ncbi:hypothetical protein [Rhodoferax sp. GW822-FHT02A01]|uniref:sensor histidine kinase n=1 Tax=Rhodoferax sp. GW822-FHT02A01 TaxID=3141537 RepID=UPI00315CB313